MSIFQNYYSEIVYEDLILKESVVNIHQIPKFDTLIINHSSGRILKNSEFAILALSLFKVISGQEPKINRTKKSISGFNTRENQTIGCRVHLNNKRLFWFLEKLVFVILPRFNSFDSKVIQKSNYNFGISELLIFPELERHSDFFELIHGCNINITTSAKSKSSCQVLLSAFKLII